MNRLDKTFFYSPTFKIGDKVICKSNSFNLKGVFNDKKVPISLISKELNISTYLLKKYLDNPLLFKISQLKTICTCFKIDYNEAIKIYLKENDNIVIHSSNLTIGNEYTVIDVSEDKLRIRLSELHKKEKSKNQNFLNNWRFYGVKVKIPYRNFLGVGMYKTKNIYDK